MKKHIILFASFLFLSGSLFAAYRPSLSYSLSLTESKAYGITFPCVTLGMEGTPLAFSFGRCRLAMEGSNEVILPSSIIHNQRMANRFKISAGPSVCIQAWEYFTLRTSFQGGVEFFPLIKGLETFFRITVTPEIRIQPWLYATIGYLYDQGQDHQDHTIQLGMKLIAGGER